MERGNNPKLINPRKLDPSQLSGRLLPFDSKYDYKPTIAYADELQELGNGLGEGEETHEELIVLDRVGRLQVPSEYLEALGLTGQNKVRVELEGDKIVLVNPEEPTAKET